MELNFQRDQVGFFFIYIYLLVLVLFLLAGSIQISSYNKYSF